MSMGKSSLLSSVAALAVLAASSAFADSLTPTTVTGSVGLGGTFNITDKVGLIAAGTPTTAQADVMFILDTTGSMGPAISVVESALITTAGALGSFGNIATGSAQYKDRTSDGSDPFDYALGNAITTNPLTTQTAIGSFTASGGGDDPEQGLNALQQAATQPSTMWRVGSKRIEVIIGDAPSHSSPSFPPAANGASVSNTATTLMSNGVTMIALNASGVSGDTDTGLDADGQFSTLAGLVPGSTESNFTNSTTLTSEIVSAVGTSFASYSDVSLDLIGPAPADCSVSLPSAITGAFSRSSSRTFDFGSVAVTGLHAGMCSFEIGLEADGALLATEMDSFTVRGGVPEPSTWASMLLGFVGLGYLGYRRENRTGETLPG
jgi:PEP-CTERM motif